VKKSKFLIKCSIIDKIGAVCIDKRTQDPQTGQYVIHLDNGQRVKLPPNVHSVPSLLIKSNFHVISGDEIIKYFRPTVESKEAEIYGTLGEPSGFNLTNTNSSDQYASYTDNRMNTGIKDAKDNFVDANHTIQPIRADPDNYRPNKLSSDITVDKLQGNRMDEIKKLSNDEMNNMMKQYAI
jgi:hypothetical protein